MKVVYVLDTDCKAGLKKIFLRVEKNSYKS